MEKNKESKDFFDRVEYENAVAVGVKKALEQIKEKTLERYNAYAEQVSGANDSLTNNHYRRISWDFSNFLAELDKEIANPLFPSTIPYDVSTMIGRTKNEITDIICPLDGRTRGTGNYLKELHKAQHLANTLEEFLMEAFMLGYGLNSKLSDEEKKDIDNFWMKKTQSDLRRAYDAGSRALVMLLQARMASPSVDNELKSRGL